MVGHNTSEGTKVTLGEHAPVVQEGAGAVAPDSLAAESVREGGEFASNKRNTISTEAASNLASSKPHEAPGSLEASSEQGQAAPSYVDIQRTRDSSGPHGANITQDPGMTGRPAKFNVEVGGKEDPGREAVHSMLLKQTKGAPGTGEREVGERGKEDEQPYGVLGRETSA
ncbi:hypothetical protein M406DRAFT_358371 [Cryphonectria parasitica EP155]|uniref:Uncharacterized protein n=1 Tax=Cryphonectria parasitica (strain ATCC 38755 / EP155) TaxID=660469 RepID=A0A9P4XU81_CRYP1|nr:uncharacterized protein M406DRAFT_358371 [Cryphonectria parasitica EP155]KAF3760855.1 hypothetical protein M406DRAFT_358371 [Cryphonectria parasitica EP155]